MVFYIILHIIISIVWPSAPTDHKPKLHTIDQTDRQTDRHRHRCTDTQTHRVRHRHTHTHPHTHTHTYTHIHTHTSFPSTTMDTANISWSTATLSDLYASPSVILRRGYCTEPSSVCRSRRDRRILNAVPDAGSSNYKERSSNKTIAI